MKTSRIVLAGILVFFGAMSTIIPSALNAQNIANPLSAFQVTVPVNINNFVFTPVTLPAGKRLVIQNVSLSGAAETTGADIQPIVILGSTLGSGSTNLRYFAPNQSGTVPGQYFGDFETTLYADTLEVGPAFAGYTPNFLAFNVVITGYLVSVP